VINIPVIAETDILIVGGSTGGVEAALAAARAGKRAFCVSSYTYLGDDVCASARYWLDPDQEPATELSQTVFAAALAGEQVLTPMQVKYPLEQAVIRAGIPFLYMTYPVCLLRDTEGRLAGLVVVNRSGFQAIRAGAIIDATERATVGRLSGAPFRDLSAGDYPCRRVVVGGAPPSDSAVACRELPGMMHVEDRTYTGYEITLQLPLSDTSPQAFAAAEVQARLRSWHPDQLVSSDRLRFRLPDRLEAAAFVEQWGGADAVALKALRCGNDALFVLSGSANVSDAVAAALEKPCNLMALGQRLGAHVAVDTPVHAAGSPLVVQYGTEPAAGRGEVRRRDHYFRLAGAATVPFDLNRLPELGQYDVVVAGGGTGGAPAGIAATRAGAKSVVLEYLPNLGGVGTEGRIACYYHGNRCGFTTEIDHGVHDIGPNPEFEWDSGKWNTEWKKAWYLKAAVDAGCEVWFGALTIAAVVEDGNRLAGVAVVSPYGLGLLRAGAVVDATGNADVAAAAGGEVVNISKAHVAVQGTGLGPVTPGQHYQNTDHTFVDDTDVMDVTRAFALARQKFNACFDLIQMVDSRQRQQAVGDLCLDPLDFLAQRTFPDTVVTARSNFDSHGFTIHPVFMAKSPDHESLDAHVPLRSLLPHGLEGILVTGLGVSSHRDSLPIIRMQPDVQNQGYAAGRAAAMAVASGCGLRAIDIRALQKHLVEVGILDAGVLTHDDSFPVSDAQVAEAVATGTDDYLGLAVIFGTPDRSLPLLRDAYGAATDADIKLRYAQLLGLMADGTGVDTLVSALDAAAWDKGWDYTGMGQFGFSLSSVDSLLVALGRTMRDEAKPVLLRKAAALSVDAEFSHLRALTLACEVHPMPEVVPEFVRLLNALRGCSRSELAVAMERVPESSTDTSERNRELRELLLARGLYACGDFEGKAAAVLAAYAKDLHGHYARHARAILGNG